VPKQIADEHGIKPGDEITWLSSGDSIRVVPGRRRVLKDLVGSRLRLFDRATERQQARNGPASTLPKGSDRGWTRDDLYGKRASEAGPR
jgi:antitoxin component of MazEF toxin-antitoxin module